MDPNSRDCNARPSLSYGSFFKRRREISSKDGVADKKSLIEWHAKNMSLLATFIQQRMPNPNENENEEEQQSQSIQSQGSASAINTHGSSSTATDSTRLDWDKEEIKMAEMFGLMPKIKSGTILFGSNTCDGHANISGNNANDDANGAHDDIRQSNEIAAAGNEKQNSNDECREDNMDINTNDDQDHDESQPASQDLPHKNNNEESPAIGDADDSLIGTQPEVGPRPSLSALTPTTPATPIPTPIPNNHSSSQISNNSIPLFRFIPSISRTKHCVHTLHKVDLETKSLDVSLASIDLLWKKRVSRHAKKKKDKNGDYDMTPVPFPIRWLKNGPLCMSYQSVMSFDIMQLDCEECFQKESSAENTNTGAGIRKQVPIPTQEAFGLSNTDGSHQSYSEEVKVKRMKIYFYDDYAIALERIIEEVQAKFIRGGATGKECVRDRIFLSLKNIPPICILPYQHVNSKGATQKRMRVDMYNGDGKSSDVEDFDDPEERVLISDYGSMADYCLCVGGRSSIKIDSEKENHIRWDSEEMEIRVLVKDGKEGTVNECEYIISKKTVLSSSLDPLGGMKATGNRRSGLGDVYLTFKAAAQVGKSHMDLPSPVRHSLRAERQVTNTSGSNRISQFLNTSSSAKRRRATSKTGEDKKLILLQDVRQFHEQTSKQTKIKRQFDIYAVVQHFTPPRFTKKGQFMMTLSLFDETLPLLKGGSVLTEGRNCTAASPSSSQSFISLLIFRKEKEDLPQIQSAGDVIHGRRLTASEWNGLIQIDAWSRSDIVVCRPTKGALKQYEMSNGEEDADSPSSKPSSIEDDWVRDGATSTYLDYERINRLWRIAQIRISFYPHIDHRFKFNIDDFAHSEGREQDQDKRNGTKQHGDLTGMFCGIIPYCEEKRSNRSPMGILRFWDGTGAIDCDKLPNNYAIPAGWSSREEPAEEAIIAVSAIVKQMNIGHGNYRRLHGQNKTSYDNIEIPVRLCGKVVNAVIWEVEHWNLLRSNKSNFRIGKFFTLKNASFSAESLNINVSTFVTPIPNTSFEVKQIIEKHHVRLSRGHPFNRRSAYLPLNLPDRITRASDFKPTWFNEDRYPSLLDVVMDKSARLKTTNVRFQIKEVTPCPPPDFDSLVDVVISNGSEHKYQLVFQIRDRFMDLLVIVPDNVVEKICGISAYQVMQEERAASKDLDNISDRYEEGCRRLRSMKEKSVDADIAVVMTGGKKYFVLADEPLEVTHSI